MRRSCSLLIIAAAGFLSLGSSVRCARYAESAGDVAGTANEAATVVLHVTNESVQLVELRTLVDGRYKFIGSVGTNDSTRIVLDPVLFPIDSLYLVAIPVSGVGRVVVGPLAAAKGDKITLSLQPALEMSHAIVGR